ncbi:MAG: hypothetical protein IPK10_15925 [Bacteroidetes bacterium]|nr:hypothetical protein [Bacteroidota bacterium]
MALATYLIRLNFYRAGHPPLTAEDQLEIIACGGGATNLNSLKGKYKFNK